jgi:predicted O-linked N-acetylglucosamine transferase (SPINDLY family)
MLLESLQSCKAALSLDPDYMEAYHNQANALSDLLQYEEAEQSYRQALELKPTSAESLKGLANLLKNLGRNSEALSSIRAALSVSPGDLAALDTLLFVLNYDTEISSADLFAEYEAYGEAVASAAKHRFEHDDRAPVEGRRIRIGYSSPDFRGHVCRFHVEPIFRNHDREQFELFAYSNTTNPDDHTERMKSYFDHWVDVVRMSDEEMAQRVYDDQIDILVDMAGHTAGNRLPVFAMRPAPIQASSSIGFGYTTGLKEVDYFICDENLVPAGSEAYFSEEPLRLPAPCLAYAPPRDVIPDISELPALSKGYVTFGSLTRLTRLNDPQLRIWGEILERVPGSRLRLDQKPFAHEGTREMFWERLEGLGIARDRVDLTCSSPHWDAYRGIDITLDCWPHNAGTTTIESLWMGVPVLSKLDRVSVGRVGAMILEPLGLGDWLVESEEDYVARAVAAASDLGSLAELRGELRSRLEGSALLDEAAFAQNLEEAYLQALQKDQGVVALSVGKGLAGSHTHTQAKPGEQHSFIGLSPPEELISDLTAHLNSGEIQEAELLAKSLTFAFPNHSYPWMFLGAILKDLGRFQEALGPAKRSVELCPENAEAQYSLANIFRELQDFAAAEASYLQAILLKPEFAAAHCSFGDLLFSLNRLSEARVRYSHAVRLNPQNATALNGLGAVCKELFFFAEAEDCYRSAIRCEPKFAEALSNLGALLIERDRLDEAESVCRQAVRIKPSLSEAHSNLGNVLNALRQYDEAKLSCQMAIKLNRHSVEAHNNLGVALGGAGDQAGSEASFREAIQLRPAFSAAHNNLRALLYDLKRYEEALASALMVCDLEPSDAESHDNVGVALRSLGRLDEAEERHRQAIAMRPEYATAYNHLGVVLSELGKLEDAEASCKKAIALKPDFPEAHYNLANTLGALGRLNEAKAHLNCAIEFKPDFLQAHTNLSNTLQNLGKLDEAAASAREAIRLDPRHHKAYNNLLFCLNYDPRQSAAELFGEYEAYGETVAGLTKHRFAHDDRPPVEGRRIRVGYSSPDFRGHVCRFFMEPIFRNHNRGQFELFAYSNTSNPDQHTERMKSYFDHWVDVVRMSDEEMAQRVYDDQIDILVDMAGHTAGNRLPVFAMRPAPIQASSSIGFGYTTGLKEVDYFICDENLVPAGSEAYFSEEPLRLPAPCLAYAPPRDVIPDISELPALSKGYVTFGSLTRLTRLNDPQLRIWGEILERVPGSRLRLDQKPFAHEGTREMFWERLEGLGIARDRVDLTCSSPHWDAYREIDITLDCWPHNAGTTTIESLWMGVPVLSKLDRVSVGRVGAMILEPLGLGDWLVESEEDYVARAVAAASDLDSLTSLRSALRQRIEKSRLVDEVAFALKLDAAYRGMLQNYKT